MIIELDLIAIQRNRYMKQHITSEQLNELSSEQKEKLTKWWKPEYGDWIKHIEEGCCDEEHLYHEDNDEGGGVGNNYNHRIDDPKLEYLPLLSIGQMIEFLDDQYKNGNKFSLSIERSVNGWFLYESGDDCLELCDALWSACKSII